jgi:pimeloyl-ACP methyl ester carboxylesterase
VIHGTADKTVPIEATAREVARKVPHATLIEYNGEPHGLFATQTQRLISDLMDFLEGRAPQDSQEILDEVTAQAMMTNPLL